MGTIVAVAVGVWLGLWVYHHPHIWPRLGYAAKAILLLGLSLAALAGTAWGLVTFFPDSPGMWGAVTAIVLLGFFGAKGRAGSRGDATTNKGGSGSEVVEPIEGSPPKRTGPPSG